MSRLAISGTDKFPSSSAADRTGEDATGMSGDAEGVGGSNDREKVGVWGVELVNGANETVEVDAIGGGRLL